MGGLSSALGSLWAWISYTFDPLCGPVGLFRLCNEGLQAIEVGQLEA